MAQPYRDCDADFILNAFDKLGKGQGRVGMVQQTGACKIQKGLID
jgi:hypothetical protein